MGATVKFVSVKYQVRVWLPARATQWTTGLQINIVSFINGMVRTCLESATSEEKNASKWALLHRFDCLSMDFFLGPWPATFRGSCFLTKQTETLMESKKLSHRVLYLYYHYRSISNVFSSESIWSAVGRSGVCLGQTSSRLEVQGSMEQSFFLDGNVGIACLGYH